MHDSIWLSEDFLNEMERMERELLWGPIKPYTPPSYDSYVKLAWVMIDGKRRMIGVHNQDMKGYKLDEKYPTIGIPLQPIEYDEFIRWCTGFDV